MPSTELSLDKKPEAQAIALSVPRSERVLASAAYLSALGGFPFIVPAALYLWKGKESRFLGFHAVQAVMLQVALIPIAFFVIGIAMALGALVEGIGGQAGMVVGMLAMYTVLGLALMIPAAVTLWMGLSALRGQPRSLPLLGRWAQRVVGDDL